MKDENILAVLESWQYYLEVEREYLTNKREYLTNKCSFSAKNLAAFYDPAVEGLEEQQTIIHHEYLENVKALNENNAKIGLIKAISQDFRRCMNHD